MSAMGNKKESRQWGIRSARLGLSALASLGDTIWSKLEVDEGAGQADMGRNVFHIQGPAPIILEWGGSMPSMLTAGERSSTSVWLGTREKRRKKRGNLRAKRHENYTGPSRPFQQLGLCSEWVVKRSWMFLGHLQVFGLNNQDNGPEMGKDAGGAGMGWISVMHMLNLEVYWKFRWRCQIEISGYKIQSLREKTELEIQI